jgi:hypothetical protein
MVEAASTMMGTGQWFVDETGRLGIHKNCLVEVLDGTVDQCHGGLLVKAYYFHFTKVTVCLGQGGTKFLFPGLVQVDGAMEIHDPGLQVADRPVFLGDKKIPASLVACAQEMGVGRLRTKV